MKWNLKYFCCCTFWYLTLNFWINFYKVINFITPISFLPFYKKARNNYFQYSFLHENVMKNVKFLPLVI